MRKIIIVFVFLTIYTLQTTRAYADEKTATFSSSKMTTEEIMLINIACIPLYYLWTTMSHETSHLIAAKILHREIIEFKPFPHIEKTRRLTSYFWGGSISYEGNLHPLISSAPIIGDALIFISSDILLTHISNPIAKTFVFVAGIFCPFIDFFTNMYLFVEPNASSQSDFEVISTKAPLMISASYFLSIFAAWRMLYHGKKIFLDSRGTKEPKKKEFSFALLPVVSGDFAGIIISGQISQF